VADSAGDNLTIPVTLNITLDPETETSIYHREGTPGAYKYEKVRDAELTSAAAEVVSPTSATDIKYQAFAAGPVKTLQDALVWVDKYGVGGGTWGTNNVPAGYTSGTTEGYSEYRLFLKNDQQIKPIVLSLLIQKGELTNNGGWKLSENDTRDCISIQLYGAGVPGGAEKKITRVANPDKSDYTNVLNPANGNGQYGLISLYRFGEASYINSGYQPKYKALVLGKNITITGNGLNDDITTGGAFKPADNPWNLMGIRHFLSVGPNSTVIMEEHSKITGFYSTVNYTPVTIVHSTARFYVKGGSITGNASSAASPNPVSVSPTSIALGDVFFNVSGTVEDMTKLN
jgi:hypothetical protein